MTPTKVRMVLVEGESADGVTVDEDDFDVDTQRTALPDTAPNEVISAILGTREGAADGGYQLLSTGVTWTDHVEAAMLRDALISHKVENVMLVSAFMAAAALTQAVGDATNYERTALLFVEPYSATLAVVDTADVRSRRCAAGFSPTTKTKRWPNLPIWPPAPRRSKRGRKAWFWSVPASISR